MRKPLDLRTLHKSVVEGDSADVERAVGLIDRFLISDPLHRKARLYKGSLLTLLGEHEIEGEKAKVYIDTGLAMMLQVKDEFASASPDRLECDYICATTLAMLPDRERSTIRVKDMLTQLVARPDFENLSDFEQVRALALAASVCLARDFPNQAKSLFRRASLIDQALASKIYEDWLERSPK